MAKKNQKPGAAVSAPAKKKEQIFSLISNATLKALYRDLVDSERAVKHGRGIFDALPSGVLMDLGAGDAAISVVADAALKFKRKGKPTVPVAGFSTILGAGLLAKTRKSGKVGVVFGADTESEEWKAALDAARQHWLPIIFVSRAEAVDEAAIAREIRRAARERKRATTLLADGYLPRIHVDANDVVAVYRVAHESIDRARRGRGPTWIEGVPFKPEGKRKVANAVEAMETYLRGKGLL